ncbi:hypothetical protein A2164_02960 [Candidatus Curtissbacteria bacterium RBG_13_35_7]|uniref:Pilus assembly protein PilO n=1 Tax=Candidatus Curtissbacteria bacterium RBG_13_35_7 TaxID=1797705 RepID=A0A1F5G1Z0_9BACT|nr:MAG: hypothetical protein A2164_02960 [Candidatus Curtissbacteria bacterium RBG_13_35_7]
MDFADTATTKIKRPNDYSKILALAVPVGSIIASVIIFTLIIWPKINEIMELKKTNAELALRAERIEQKVEILKGLDPNILEEQLEASEQLLPTNNNIFSFLKQTEDMAAVSGVLLGKVEVATTDIGGKGKVKVKASEEGAVETEAEKVALNVAISGDYQSVTQFLKGIYSFSRVASIDSIPFTTTLDEETNSLKFSASFTINAYWKEFPATLGSIESPVQKLTQEEVDLLANVQKPNIILAPTVPEVPVGRGNIFTPY